MQIFLRRETELMPFCWFPVKPLLASCKLLTIYPTRKSNYALANDFGSKFQSKPFCLATITWLMIREFVDFEMYLQFFSAVMG